MKIVDSRKVTKTEFKRIALGECFLDSSKELMMRIETVTSDDDCIYNAVSLSTGELHGFNIESAVEPVKAGITIYE